jgi:cytoskeletal protein CcmA (bactofilin family)
MFKRTEDEVNANSTQKTPIFGAFAANTDEVQIKPQSPIPALEVKKTSPISTPAPVSQVAAEPDAPKQQVVEAPKPINPVNTAPLKPANQPAVGSFAPTYAKIPSVAPVVTQPIATAAPALETERRLTVGYGITLEGEISDCDRLVIFGKVNAKLNNVKFLQISESGKFSGRAQVEQAEVSGGFEGELVVKNSIVISTTGRVNGKITYGSIEIRPGGKFTGEIVENPEALNTQEEAENANATASSEYYGLYDSASGDKAA